MFSARDQNVFSFSHLAWYFLAIFSKVHAFVCITLLRFLAKCTSFYKKGFSAQDQHVLSFLHWVQHFLAFSTKVHEFVQNSVLSSTSAPFVTFALGVPLFTLFGKAHQFVQSSLFTRDQNVLSFSHLAHYVLAIFSKVHEFVQNSVFSTTSARFVIFPLGALLFSNFQQTARVCTNQRFQPEISTYCHFCTGHTTS